MSEQAAFARVLASLYDAMLDETLWPATSALIDEACGLTGNAILVAEGPPDDIRVLFVGLYYRGSPASIWSVSTSRSTIPSTKPSRGNCNGPPASWCRSQTWYTAEELKTSRTYNEALRRYQYQQA